VNPGETIIGLDLGNHLWIVISAPTSNGEVALVNLTTHGRSPSCGRACTLITTGEHPYVTRESCVYYRAAYLNPLAPLLAAREQGTLRQHEPLSTELLRRVQDGALAHNMVARIVKHAIVASR
jgi:hypothetical protein